MDEAHFSVARKAYRHHCSAKGCMDEEPCKEGSRQEGDVVVLRNAHRERARYRIFERGGWPRLRFTEKQSLRRSHAPSALNDPLVAYLQDEGET
jgi:hypothetical protein